MLMNQSFLRNLLVIALCVLLSVQAAPVKVRRSRESGSFEEPLLRKRTPIIKPDAFAPARLMRRIASASASKAKATKELIAPVPTFTPISVPVVSVSVSTLTVVQTETLIVPEAVISQLAASQSTVASAETVTFTQSPAAVPSAASVIVPPAASFTLIGSGSVAAAPAAKSLVPPAVPSGSLGSFPFISASAPVVAVSAPALAPPTGTTVTVDIGQVASGFSSAVAQAISTISAAPPTGTTVTVQIGDGITGATPIVGTVPLPSSTCEAGTIFNQAEVHPDPKTNIPLWKAIPDTPDAVSALISNPNPPRNEQGDFTIGATGFYLTDTWQAAAQAACYGSGQPVEKVAVLQYNWTPTPDLKISEFQSANVQWQAFVDNVKNGKQDTTGVAGSDMIVGPINFKKDITTTFWQYEVNSDKAMKSLDLVSVFQPVLCANIPRGNCLPFQTL